MTQAIGERALGRFFSPSAIGTHLGTMDNARMLCQPSASLRVHFLNPSPVSRPMRLVLALAALAPSLGWAQSPAELLDLRRDLDAEGVRLTVESTAPVLFDYSSPTLPEIVLRLHDVRPGPLVGISRAWKPEVALLEVVPEVDEDGRVATRLSIRLATFRRYRIRTEANRLLIVLLGKERESKGEERADPSVASESALPPGRPGLLGPEPPTDPDASGAAPSPAPTPALPEATPPAPTPPQAGPTATRVVDLSYSRDAGSLTVRITTDGAPTHRVFALQGPDRLVLDMIGMEVDPPSRRIEIGEAGIIRARLAQHQVEPELVVRIVVDLERPVPHRLVVGSRSLSVVFLVR